MPLLAVACIMGGAVFAALYNVLTKRVQNAEWKGRSAALVFLSFGGAAMLMFAASLATGGPQIQSGFPFWKSFWWSVFATGVLNIGIQYGGMKAKELEDASLVTPISSTTPAIVIFTSMVMLGEYPTTLGWIGIWLLVLGTYTLNIADVKTGLAKRVAGSGWKRTAMIYAAPFIALTKSRGVRWAFFAALLSSISLNYDGLVARRANIVFASSCVCLIAALGNLVIAIKGKEFRGVTVPDALRKTLVFGMLLAIAIILFNYAFRLSIVPYVGTMKRIGIPFTIILAYFILGERKSFKERIVAGIIMAAGATIIALGGK